MQMPQFQPQDYTCMIDKTPQSSRALGRRIYLLKQGDQCYWLKSQEPEGHPQFVLSFNNEIQLYQQGILDGCGLPYQLFTKDSSEHMPNFLRLVHAAPALLEINGLSILHIKQKMHAILAALVKLHQAGWLHGDLKPSHLRLYEHRVRLLDFEQAQNLALGETALVMNATPRYMAPELFHLNAKTQQTDLYALGIILYEWLTQQKIAIQRYEDWALYHCQQASFLLDESFSVFQDFINGLLARHAKDRFLTSQQAIQYLNSITVT
ncbi:protein kinase domain-containing protein [Acinetobacter sp. MD2(2019)]|uniref:protein kinase domain-containing protein n=1 Tax=Acinetobacter sp. MD2(2019) TaxID=2605273 RepID=UPI002D1EDCEC|nr:protein kinase [Acinetobacter sp. MD2(2019)]MEB3754783.1 protein kinase [Acinetobacter sp. MD2(2019)]